MAKVSGTMAAAGTATAEVESRARALVQSKGISRAAAVQQVFGGDEALRQRFITEQRSGGPALRSAPRGVYAVDEVESRAKALTGSRGLCHADAVKEVFAADDELRKRYMLERQVQQRGTARR